MKSVHVHIAAGGALLIDAPTSTRETHLEVTDVPKTLNANVVIRQLQRLVIWPWPQRLSWPAVKDLRQGSIYRPTEATT